MNQQINSLAALGGGAIIAGFVLWAYHGFVPALPLWIVGGILLFAGVTTLGEKK